MRDRCDRNLQLISYRRGFAGVGRMEAKVVSMCLEKHIVKYKRQKPKLVKRENCLNVMNSCTLKVKIIMRLLHLSEKSTDTC